MEFIQMSSRSLTTINIPHSLLIRKHVIKIKVKYPLWLRHKTGRSTVEWR